MDRETTPMKARRGSGNISARGKPRGRGNPPPNKSRQPISTTTPTILRPTQPQITTTTLFSPDQPRQQSTPSSHQKLYEPSSYPSSPPSTLFQSIPRNALQNAAIATNRLHTSPVNEPNGNRSSRITSNLSSEKSTSTYLRDWKLVNAQLQFCVDAPSSPTWSEMTKFQVIGCVGLEGVGKSTILSMLTGSGNPSDPWFPVQTTDTILNGKHQTNGIDLCITEDNVVYLDCQPFLSTSMLMDLTQKNESPKYGALALDQQIELQSLNLLVLMLSVCHYLIVAYDRLDSDELWQLLKVADLLKRRLPSISGEMTDHTAKLLFVGTKHVPQSLDLHHSVLHQISPSDYSLFLLPAIAKNEKFQDAIKVLETHINQLPHVSLTQKKQHTLTLKEWLGNGGRIYESIRKCQSMIEYSKLLHKIALTK